jgi:hypothetical protein
MTAVEKLKQKILQVWNGQLQSTPEQISDEWNKFTDSDEYWEVLDELRCGECETELESPHSRYYESKSVAAEMVDGTWVGWTYWYGGGKHGEPSSMEWVNEAYFVEMTEVPTVVKVFTRVENKDV